MPLNTPQSETSLDCSVVICTRNRGPLIVETLQSLLNSEGSVRFEIVVVDQSTNAATRDAVQPLLTDQRIRYMPTDTKGLGLARNIGLNAAAGEIVLMTDDDCVVPTDWVRAFAQIFTDYPKVALAFCTVLPGKWEGDGGFIPTQQYTERRLIARLSDYHGGIGAGMAVRRSAALQVGGFDERLGAGTPLLAGEEYDIVVRLLRAGYEIYTTNETSLVHNGYRPGSETRGLIRGYCFSTGVVQGKAIKAGSAEMVGRAVKTLAVYAGQPLGDLIRTGKPRGMLRPYYFLSGLLKGLSLG